MKKNNIFFFLILSLIISLVFGNFFWKNFLKYRENISFQSLYASEKFLPLLDSFSGSTLDSMEYNLGDTYMQLAKNSSTLSEQISYVKSAIEKYNAVLNEKNDADTTQNLELAEKILQQLQQSDTGEEKQNTASEQKSENSGESGTGSKNSEVNSQQGTKGENEDTSGNGDFSRSGSTSSGSNMSSQNGSSSGSGEISSQNQSSQEQTSSGNSSGKNQENSGGLSDSDMQQLQNYADNLKNSQQNYQQFYGTNQQDPFDQMQEMMNQFMGNIDRGGEKTW